MEFGIIIIGDEILSGKRQDRHLGNTAAALGERGLGLKWARVIGDDAAQITDTLTTTMAMKDTAVCCFGGIGATPDDLTRACAAKAAGVPLTRHAEARAEIEARFGEGAYPHRILMADLPRDSRLIPNPYNRIPGFSIADHHFLPGFPQMAAAMVEWVLDTYYQDYFHATPRSERTLFIRGVFESQLLEAMQATLRHHPGLHLSSLPTLDEAEPVIELSLSGEAKDVDAGIEEFTTALAASGLSWNEPAD